MIRVVGSHSSSRLPFLPLLLAALALLSGAPRASRAEDVPPLRSAAPPFFSADVTLSLDPDGRPAMGVAVTVPYQELQWIRLQEAGDRRAARAELTVVFEPDAKTRAKSKSGELEGDVWEKRLVVPGFAASRSPNATMVEKRTFELPPGRYEARITVRDMNSGISSTARSGVSVPDYSRVPLGFADLELGLLDTAGVFTPVPTRRFGTDVRSIAARAVLFDRRGGGWPRTYPFRYKVLDDLGETVVSGTLDATLSHSAEPVVVRPSSSDFFLGGYVFEVELVEGKSRWRVERSFEVDESGPPRGKEFERMLEPLAYIAQGDEIDELRRLPPDRQEAGWMEFWRRRDPTPETARNEAMLEFFRRLRYSEQHFQGYGPGWRSDMGRIYIKFGAPDQIESRPASTQSPQLEIWYYNQPYRRFVFGDREGFGRYVLLGPGTE